MTDRVKILRRELDGWREILVGLHSILTWDQQYYPAVIFVIVSIVFLLIGYIDPAILTLLSFIGILITLSDYLVPKVTSWVFHANHWTGVQERKYEEIIVSLAGGHESFSKFITSMKSSKATHPKIYVGTVTFVLLMCAFVGSSVNNLFLTYVLVLFVAMLPGLRRKNIVRKYFAVLMQQVSSFTPKAAKSEEAKKE